MKLIYKITIPVIAILIFIIAIIGFFIRQQLKNSFIKEEFLRINETVNKKVKEKLLSENFSNPEDLASREKFKIFSEDIKTPGTVRFSIWSADKKILFSSIKSLIGLNFPKHRDVSRALEEKKSFFEEKKEDENEPKETEIGDFLDIYIPININGQIMGVVEIHDVLDAVLNPITTQINNIILALGIGGAFIFIAIFIIFQIFIKNPIKILEKGSEAIGKENFDFKIAYKSNDELGKFIGDFDNMRLKLKTSLLNIRNEYERFKTLISSMDDGVLLIDSSFKIALINQKGEKLLEIKTADAVEKKISDVFFVYQGSKKIEEEKRPAAIVLKTGKPMEISLKDDYYFETKAGKRLPVVLTAAPFKDEAGRITGAIIVFRDNEEEKKIDETKSSFISVASHQLRTPLTTMRWYTEMIESEDAGPLNEDQKNFVGQIYAGILKLNETINMLLSLARIEGGRIKNEMTSLNLSDVTNNIVKNLSPLIKNKNHKVNFIEPPKELANALADLTMLEQVITNLLSNAINYTRTDGAIEIKIEKDPATENTLIYSVKDNGIGIPKEQQKNIFEKFFRADNAVTEIPEGNGLGLALIKKLVELWEGKIWFESEEGKGATFYFTISLA
ncbi:MAG: PAS domain-containing protein [Parcubacteria group bacterium]|nr:PAS domain-containing protein [Parcubacteria group bacterium]